MKLNKLPLNVIGLNRVGLNQIGSPSHRANTSARPYIDPEVLASLVAVCICDGKSNDDPDRAVIKNLVDPDNPFVISNAAYKLNSGYGKYEVDFTSWSRLIGVKAFSNKFVIENKAFNCAYYVRDTGEDLDEFKAKINNHTDGIIRYTYINQDGIVANLDISPDDSNRVFTFPKSYNSIEGVANHICGFQTPMFVNTGIIIEQIPSHQGAFVTDGKDDFITSTKTVKEMLGGSNEITVVSMIHQIGLNSTHDKAFTNYIEATNATTKYVRSQSKTAGKTGIYGYTYNGATQLLINNILGDKNDYEKLLANAANILSESSIFRVASGSSSTDTLSQVAWYWTIIANKVLTTDQINQVISYFNLDKHVKPDVYYDTIRQGITNENHASFNDELTDFSGNGHNMKIYNSAWNKESGINDEGAWQTDGVTDYGQYVGDLGLKDYTIAVDRAYVEAKPSQVSIMSNVVDGSTNTPFLMEHMGINKILAPHSFGKYTALSELNINRFISYQSTYKYNRNNLDRGTSTNTGSGLTIGRIGGVASQYANIALWSLLLFPYTLSEFLLERQLKRYKLGTLYPDMVEFRPVISGNIPYNAIEISQGSTTLYNKSINKTGIYLQEGSTVRVYIQPSGIDEVSKITINGVEYTDLPINPNGYYYVDFPITKSPQKISYAIDEYIRYEDIVQPYPAIINLKQDGKTITWGDKLKVGSDIVFVGSANLLPELYTVSETRYNGVTLYPNTIIKVEKSMVFDNARTYLKANEPNCILSPNRLRIPNSSYKILRYIPDLTGKGNHGRLNNFAYTEESGANEDGSIRFDGTDDHITIPTLSHGSKCMLMKVNWNKDALMLYDQRRDNNPNSFAIYIPNFNDNEDSIAYSSRNDGKTYIDGVLNTSVKGSQLKDVTHNITITNSNSNNDNTVSPAIGSNAKYNAFYAQMVLYEFMLLPDVPDEEEIKELNDIVGIENNIEVS
jgi:hypothetical protein